MYTWHIRFYGAIHVQIYNFFLLLTSNSFQIYDVFRFSFSPSSAYSNNCNNTSIHPCMHVCMYVSYILCSQKVYSSFCLFVRSFGKWIVTENFIFILHEFLFFCYFQGEQCRDLYLSLHPSIHSVDGCL